VIEERSAATTADLHCSAHRKSLTGLRRRRPGRTGSPSTTPWGGAGPTVVLLHGYPQTWYMWRKVMSALAGHYTVIAPDLRGSGGSDAPAGGYDKATSRRTSASCCWLWGARIRSAWSGMTSGPPCRTRTQRPTRIRCAAWRCWKLLSSTRRSISSPRLPPRVPASRTSASSRWTTGCPKGSSRDAKTSGSRASSILTNSTSVALEGSCQIAFE
jgi:hypothetical protein